MAFWDWTSLVFDDIIKPYQTKGAVKNGQQNILCAWYAPLHRERERPNVQHRTMLHYKQYLAE